MVDMTHKQNKGRQRQLTTTYGRLNFITDIGFVCSTCMHVVSVCTVIKIITPKLCKSQNLKIT